jgi:hypothetical protein
MQKSKKKKKPKIIYYPAPQKSRAALFFTSFFVTLAMAAAAIGFAFVDANSQRLGWGHDIEVFDIVESGSDVGFSVMGKNFTVKTSDINSAKAFINRLVQSRTYLMPEPFQFAEIAAKKLYNLEYQLIYYSNFEKDCENLLSYITD